MFLFSLRLKPLAHTKKQWIWSSLYLPLFRAVLQRFSLTVGWRRHHGSPQAGGAWSAPWRLSWWEGNFAGNVLKIRRAGEWMHSNGNCRQKAMHPTRSHPERKSSIRRAGRWMSPVAISPLTQVEGEWLRAVACQRLQIRDLGWSGGSRYIYMCVCACVCVSCCVPIHRGVINKDPHEPNRKHPFSRLEKIGGGSQQEAFHKSGAVFYFIPCSAEA